MERPQRATRSFGRSSLGGVASQISSGGSSISPRALHGGLRDAGLLVANLSHLLVEATDWVCSELAVYDLGQAVAQMSF